MIGAVYSVLIEPAEEPITVAEAKLHARIDSDAEDSILAYYIAAARQMCEQRIGRPIIAQTITRKSDDWPDDDDIELLRAPVQSISSITYLDADGATQTVSTSVYTLDNEDEHGAAWVILQDDQTWPTVGAYANAVTVTFVAGYGAAADVPAALKAWVAVATTWLFEHRGGGELPPDFCAALIDRYRMWTL